jgi:hypothetical protein
MTRFGIILICLSLLSALPARGQGQAVLPDGICGRDRTERLLFVQAFSAQSDSVNMMTDTLGRFEIDPAIMDRMRGDVYLKPMDARPKVRLSLVAPFDTIDAYRQGRTRYLTQDYVFEKNAEEEVFYYDPDVTLLQESVVRARRHAVARDKVTGYLDSLTIMLTGEWVCYHGPNKHRYLNDFRGYSHHPVGCPGAEEYNGPRLLPKRGESYDLIRYEPVGPNGEWYLTKVVYDFEYQGPDYTEEELLEMNGMWKAQGYFPEREFYQPDELERLSATPDFRNLLQWQPAVLTDENGIAEIPFTASDVNTEFVGLVEAVDGTGLLGAQTFIFRVIKE